MPVPRPAIALRAANSIAPKTALRPSSSRTVGLAATQLKTKQDREFSTSMVRKADHAHEDRYDPPTGWLFGVKPGEKAEKEGWENIWIYGFWGSLVVLTVGYAFKPDTTIQTWALEEARRRLEAEGILKEPGSES